MEDQMEVAICSGQHRPVSAHMTACLPGGTPQRCAGLPAARPPLDRLSPCSCSHAWVPTQALVVGLLPSEGATGLGRDEPAREQGRAG